MPADEPSFEDLSAGAGVRSSLEHWPDDIWADYPSAYVRLTTLRTDGRTHLLFGCVELLPRETELLPGHEAPLLRLPGGARAMSSLTVTSTKAALSWYEGALSGLLAIPGVDGPAAIEAVRLAPEPRLGDLVVARTPTVPVGWTSGPRMHRMVPMEGLPAAVVDALSPTPGRPSLRGWMLEHCFVDLGAFPDCAGGLVLLAANPVIQHISDYPLRKFPSGREVIGIRVVPRAGCTLDTIAVRLSEMRPDGVGSTRVVVLDETGEAEVVLSQEARETALEVTCSRRGLLHASPYAWHLRSVDLKVMPVRATMTVQVPPRSKSDSGSRHEVPVADGRLDVGGQVGSAAETGAAARLELLLSTRARPQGGLPEQVLFRDDRSFAVSFVRRLVAHAGSRVLFVDPYFGFEDVREFALSAWSGSPSVGVVTSARVGWTGRVQHLESQPRHGDLMLANLEQINRIRNANGLSSVTVAIMAEPGVHDRFLVVDDTVWHFGDSFRTLGGGLSMASRVGDVPSLLATLLDASAGAVPFADYWARAKPKVTAP